MVLAGGEVIDQSLNIMLEVLRDHDPLMWLPTTEDALARSLNFIRPLRWGVQTTP